MAKYPELYEAILHGDAKASERIAQQALNENADPMELVSESMIPAMDEVGRLFECEEYFVPELLLSGRAMKAALGLIRPMLAACGAEPAGRVVIGTVKGDLHDIGKNLVASMLEGAGFEVADLSPEKFIEAVRAANANIVCLSALLTVTMPAMKTTIEAMKTAGIREKVKVMVGGAPVTESYAREIGADGYTENASGAVGLARRLNAGRQSP
jgi:5-methyltetrahydrofolate--homocysteine methyltransferase